MQALWDWAFASDGTIVMDGDNNKVLLMKDDELSVFSDRHQAWFADGKVVACFRHGIRVHYGSNRYFGFRLERGNTKFLHTSEIPKKVKLLGPKRII